MDILILGGTQFVGRHIVEALLAAGHRVSILNRGRTPDELPAQVERLRGDRDAGDAGLAALDGRAWDVCVDVSGYTARQVRPSAERLRGRVGRYVYISTVGVYGDPAERPVRETHPRVEPADEALTEVVGENYARLKVTCENIIQQLYPDRHTLLRPQSIVGPHDPTGRYTYWAQRATQGGEMLAPGDGSDHIQVIDARDVARFARAVVERGLGGAFNLAGPRLTWAEFLRLLGARDLVWVPAEIILAAGLTFVEMPLYRPERGPRSSLMDVSIDRAQAAGLTLTDPQVTAHDTQAWLAGRDLPRALSPELEAQLIRTARQRRGAPDQHGAL